VIEVTINDSPKTIAVDQTIAALLAELKIESPAIAVEINQQLKPRNTFDTTIINAGDAIEIVTLVGGG
jgi:thiamine biosynthesis protein ThiS